MLGGNKAQSAQHHQYDHHHVRPPISPPIRSATRITALRARGLTATLSGEGRTALPSRRISCGGAQRQARGQRRGRCIAHEPFDDAVFEE